ncbi:O-linked N-acetylglucosamine transferase, SPINDLY family protein [Chthoniobacter flavus]
MREKSNLDMTTLQAMQIALQHHQSGRLADAEAIYRQILAVEPRHADALHLLGVIAHQVGQHEGAIELIGEAVQLNPNDAAALCNLGEAYRVSGRLEEAIVAYRRALCIQPGQPEACSNLGNVLRSVGRMDEAIDACRRATQLRPGYVEAHLNLANALSEHGRSEEALAEYRCALEIDPHHAEAWNSYGSALVGMQRLVEAEAAFRQAIQWQPQHAGAWSNLGGVLAECGRHDEAVAAYRRALEINPADASVQSNLICTLQFHPTVEWETIAEERRAWNGRFGQAPTAAGARYTNVREAERPLRIGYVSPDFRDHVVGRNLLPLFREHDRRHFEILCYSGVAQPDAMTTEFRRLAGVWRHTLGAADDALTRMIQQDGVDILVDLTQHMARSRLTLFARRPAPVQVSFAGYPETTGLAAIPYRISDRYLESQIGVWRSEMGWKGEPELRSPNSVLRSAEHVFPLDSFWCYDPGDEKVEGNELPCQQTGRVTFGCLNNFCKLNEQTWKSWARILRQVSGSRLILLSAPGSHRQRVVDGLEREGIDPRRIEFVERAPRRGYLEYYQRLDIALDSFPYNGHTTSLDALWMGVPVVSRAGRGPLSRAGWSQLSNLGLPELVAFSEDDYIRIAVELAGDIPRLSELRATLRRRMEASVLMDAVRFTRQIEETYRAMWREWCGRGDDR